jgi:hypothetical protein
MRNIAQWRLGDAAVGRHLDNGQRMEGESNAASDSGWSIFGVPVGVSGVATNHS